MFINAYLSKDNFYKYTSSFKPVSPKCFFLVGSYPLKEKFYKYSS